MSQQNKSRITVDINGQQYTIVGDENTNHIRMVASMVDGKMKEISEANPYLDTNKLAVLTAVNIVSEYLSLKDDYNVLKKKINKEEEATKDD